MRFLVESWLSRVPADSKKARTRMACFARAARLWLFRLCSGMRQEGEDLGTLWKLGKNGRPRRRRRVQVRSYGGSQIFEATMAGSSEAGPIGLGGNC